MIIPDLSLQIQAMQENGFTVLNNIFTIEECNEAKHQLDHLAKTQEQGCLECLFNKASIFERIYQVPTLLKFIRYFLGQDALLSAAHGSILPPGSGAGGLHTDGNITGHNRSQSMALADQHQRITSHVLALNIIFCISEFTQTNGATCLVPGSHLHPTLEEPPEAQEKASIVEAAPGSVILFNVNTWHGSSKNTSNQTRYALLTPWRRFWTRCEYEMARIVKPEVLARAGAEGREIFGIAAQSPYLPVAQWDRTAGEPTAEWIHLKRS